MEPFVDFSRITCSRIEQVWQYAINEFVEDGDYVLIYRDNPVIFQAAPDVVANYLDAIFDDYQDFRRKAACEDSLLRWQRACQKSRNYIKKHYSIELEKMRTSLRQVKNPFYFTDYFPFYEVSINLGDPPQRYPFAIIAYDTLRPNDFQFFLNVHILHENYFNHLAFWFKLPKNSDYFHQLNHELFMVSELSIPETERKARLERIQQCLYNVFAGHIPEYLMRAVKQKIEDGHFKHLRAVIYKTEEVIQCIESNIELLSYFSKADILKNLKQRFPHEKNAIFIPARYAEQVWELIQTLEKGPKSERSVYPHFFMFKLDTAKRFGIYDNLMELSHIAREVISRIKATKNVVDLKNYATFTNLLEQFKQEIERAIVDKIMEGEAT